MPLATICASHSPLMLGSLSAGDPTAETEIRETFREAAQWLRDFDPELIVVFGPDHFNGLFYDLMPPFCVGVEAVATQDWGIAPGTLTIPADAALGCVRAAHDASVDVAISYRLKVDHGTTIPLNYLAGGIDAYPVLPIVINCVADPIPAFRRCRLLGEAVGRYVASLGLRAIFIGSGGLSHDPPHPGLAKIGPAERWRLIDNRIIGPEEYEARQSRVVRAARQLVEGGGPCLPPNKAWDDMVLGNLVDQRLEAFDSFADDEVDRVGGHGGREVRTWVAACAALRAAGPYRARVDCYRIVPEWITGMAILRANQEAA